jgi:quercetin dioxygenase-like cupin family protein
MIEHWDPKIDSELSEANMRAKLEARGYIVNKYAYPSGTYFPDHSHEIDKIDGILSGKFRLTIQGQSLILRAGDCLAVPRGVVHSAEVVGSEPAVCLDAVKIQTTEE